MDKVYFEVRFTESSGLTDELGQLLVARKLGLSLGYAYFHKGLRYDRCVWRAQPLRLPWFLARRVVPKVHGWFMQIFPRKSVWSHLGLDRHFARREEREGRPDRAECKRAEIILADRALEENGISTCEALKDYVRETVSRESLPGQPLLLTMAFEHPMKSVCSIVNTIPCSADDLDLKTVWRAARKGPRGRSSRDGYPLKGLKTLAHVRLGDVAAVRTPWETWIYWRRKSVEPGKSVKGWYECRDESEFAQLTVADVHDFLQRLVSHFTAGAFAMQIFSDGFERTFSALFYWGRETLSPKQMKLLLKCRGRCANEFKPLKEIGNSVSVIGESHRKLFKLIDAVMTADLLIAAFPAQSMCFNLARHFLPAKPPVAVLLYKPVMEKEMQIFLKNNPSDNVIPVDISAPDFGRIAARLTELLPSLAPFSRLR